jgi:hypothetical protein
MLNHKFDEMKLYLKELGHEFVGLSKTAFDNLKEALIRNGL